MLLLHARASKLLLSLDAGNGTNPIFFFVLSLFVCARMEIKQSGRLERERVNWLDAKKINPEEILKYIKIFHLFLRRTQLILFESEVERCAPNSFDGDSMFLLSYA